MAHDHREPLDRPFKRCRFFLPGPLMSGENQPSKEADSHLFPITLPTQSMGRPGRYTHGYSLYLQRCATSKSWPSARGGG